MLGLVVARRATRACPLMARARSKWPVPMPPPDDRLPSGCLVGIVTSDKMNKTVVVTVKRQKTIPKLDVKVNYHRKFLAHDETEECKIGDRVRIFPTRKLSKRKHFAIQSVLRRAPDLGDLS